MPERLAPRLQILTTAMLFSTGGAAIKMTALSSWQIAGFRSGLAALALLIAVPTFRDCLRPRSLLVGVAYAGTLILYVAGNKLTTAANTIFLQSTAPLYVMLLAPLLLRERARLADFVFAASLAGGMALFFVGTEPPRATAPDPAAGNLLGAAAGVCWAFTLLGLRWLGRMPRPGDADPAGSAVVAGNLIAFTICLPMALPVAASAPTDWLVVAYLGLFQIGLAYALMVRAVPHLPALETSLLLLVEPVLNALLAWLVHAERPAAWSLAGCTIILGATLVRTLKSPAERVR